jgi:hypothetical protein
MTFSAKFLSLLFLISFGGGSRYALLAGPIPYVAGRIAVSYEKPMDGSDKGENL